MNNQSSVPTPDEIWSILREVSTSQKETGEQIKTLSAKTDKQIETLSAKTDRQIEKMSIEMDKRNRQTDRHIQKIGGRFNQRWGALVESLVEGKLVKILQARGIDITQTHTRSVAWFKKPDGSVQEREFDIIVANGSEVVEVEVKTTLDLRDVKSFIEKIRDFKKYFPRYKTETVYGAVAYLKSEGEAHSYAEEQGFVCHQGHRGQCPPCQQGELSAKGLCLKKGVFMNNQSSVPTPDEVWSLLRETGEQIKTLSADLSEKQQKTDRQIENPFSKNR